jgi:hypothetical protein
MKLKPMLALYAGASLLLVSPAVFADDDHAASAMQMMIDEKTGNKIEHEDDAGHAPAVMSTGIPDTGGNSNISAMIPATTPAPQTNADGSMSAQIGLEYFKYLVVTKNEQGEAVFTHVPADQFEVKKLPASSEQEEK